LLCPGGSPATNPEEETRNHGIETSLRSHKKSFGSLIKLLLLGAGDSGKTTLVKQMKILFESGFSQTERESFKTIIHANIMTSMRCILSSLHKAGKTALFSEENLKSLELFLAKEVLVCCEINEEIGGMIRNLWKEESVRNTFFQSAFQSLIDPSILETSNYFFESIDRISSRDYLPSDEDILRARAKTTGVHEIKFQIESTCYSVTDVGGQRTERRKWIHCFSDIQAIIFCVSMIEYNMLLIEDVTVNRMVESLSLFGEVCNSAYFSQTCMILIFNKYDLFQQKIKSVDLNMCFPEYNGGCDEEKGLEFMKKKFVGLNQSTREVYVHVTSATTSNHVRDLFVTIPSLLANQSM